MTSSYSHGVEVNVPLYAALGAAAALYLLRMSPAVIIGVLFASAALFIVTYTAAGSSSRGRSSFSAPPMGGLHRRLRFIATVLLAVCVGLALGGAVRLHLISREASQYVPVAQNEIRSVTGRLSQDARRTDSGRWVTSLNVKRVGTLSGSYDARLDLRVFTFGPRPPAGSRARFVGELMQSKRGTYFSAAKPGEYGEGSPVQRLRSAAAGRLAGALSEVGPSAGLASALLLGRRDGLSPFTQDLFRMSGTAHILALSGMHLGILIAMALFGLSRFVGKRRALFAALVLVACYLFVVGFRASLVRAALMFAFVVAAVLLDRKAEPLRILAAVFIVLMVTAPASVDGLSFQLSFAALFGIIVFGSRLDRLSLPWLPRALRSPLAASVGAQLATMPLILDAFGTARPIGIVATLVVAPLAVVFVWAAVIGTVVALVGSGWSLMLLNPLRDAMAALEEALLGVVELFAGAPGLSMNGTGPFITAIGVCGLALLVAYLDAPLRVWPRSGGGRSRREPQGERCGVRP